jgi:hypothetical protein
MGAAEDRLPAGRLRIVEVADAEPLAGDLFRRHFGCDPPNYPRHFVATYVPDAGELAAILRD